MRFCENCGNMLIPKSGKLFCKACEEEFELGKDKESYKIVKKIHHDENETAPIIIKEGLRGERISEGDRRAYEDYFGSSEADGY